MSNKAGDEVLAFCGSCKIDLAATIVAMNGSKIARVLCRTCKKERAYKSAKGVTTPGAVVPKATRSRSSAKAESQSPAVAIHDEWMNKMKESSSLPKLDYAMTKAFKPGEVIKHPTFGDGVITKSIHPDKIEVIFETDLKILLHSRA